MSEIRCRCEGCGAMVMVLPLGVTPVGEGSRIVCTWHAFERDDFGERLQKHICPGKEKKA